MFSSRYVVGLLILALTASSCSAKPPHEPVAPATVEAAALDSLLLSAGEVDAVMGTHGFTPQPATTELNDHQTVVANLNCLGIWQTAEAAVYENSGRTGLRRQSLRMPDNDQWDDLVVQSVASFPSASVAAAFFTDSSDRWSKCTNHRLNIAAGAQPPTAWTSGELTKTDTDLTIPVTRQAGDQVRQCQRVLAHKANVIIDLEACKPESVTQGGVLVNRIEAKLPQ
jgi:hypothetical protein